MQITTGQTASKPTPCPWEGAKEFAIGAGFTEDLRTASLDAALTMLRRRLGFLCLATDEVEAEVRMALEAAGIAA